MVAPTHARMDAYRCPHCKAWHVGNRTVKKRRAW